jgi:hypothetical protein
MQTLQFGPSCFFRKAWNSFFYKEKVISQLDAGAPTRPENAIYKKTWFVENLIEKML